MTQHICGIDIFNSTSNNLNNNKVKDNWIGIYLYQSNSTNITGNIITGNGGGISTYDSNNTTISGNNFTDNWLTDTSTVNSANIVMATTIYTCGPAALATVMKHLGVNATEMELAQLARTDETGTSMWGLAQAALYKGLTAKGFIINDTSQLKTDYIVVLNINGVYHYNIIRNITNTTVYLTDPNLGDIEMSLAKFRELYTGFVLVIANGNIQINATNMTDPQMKDIKAMSIVYMYKTIPGYWYQSGSRWIDTSFTVYVPYLTYVIDYWWYWIPVGHLELRVWSYRVKCGFWWPVYSYQPAQRIMTGWYYVPDQVQIIPVNNNNNYINKHTGLHEEVNNYKPLKFLWGVGVWIDGFLYAQGGAFTNSGKEREDHVVEGTRRMVYGGAQIMEGWYDPWILWVPPNYDGTTITQPA